MALKAKENVRKTDFGIGLWLGIILVVLYVIMFFQPSMALLPEGMIRTTVTYIIYVVTFAAFIYLLFYTSFWYVMVLSHKELKVDWYLSILHGKAVTVQCKDFTGIMPAERYTGNARVKRLTILAKLEGFGKYILTYNENGEEKALKIQCTRHFKDQVQQLIDLNERQHANAAKEQDKKKKKSKKK